MPKPKGRSVSEQKLKLIIGLGNIGDEYGGTRHNLGFYCIDQLAAATRANWHLKPKFQAFVAEVTLDGQKVILAKPTTFYNLSGEAASAICRFYKIEPTNVLVIHDELDLPFGTIRTRIGSSDAGNNGIKNISAHLGEQYARIRVGIGNAQRTERDAAAFVLDYFLPDEQVLLPRLAEHVASFAHAFVDENSEFLHTSVQVE